MANHSPVHPMPVGSPSLHSCGLKMVVKNTVIEFQPVGEVGGDGEEETDDQRQRSFTDPPKASPKFNTQPGDKARSTSDEGPKRSRTRSDLETLQESTAYECVEVASDATDFDHLVLPEAAEPEAPGSPWNQKPQEGGVPYTGYSPVMMPGSPPMLIPANGNFLQCGEAQHSSNAAELSARAAALESMAKDCRAAATEQYKSRGGNSDDAVSQSAWARAPAHQGGNGDVTSSPSTWAQAAPYIPGQSWSPMQQMQMQPGWQAQQASPTSLPVAWSAAGWHTSSHDDSSPSWHSMAHSQASPASRPTSSPSRSAKDAPVPWEKSQKQTAEVQSIVKKAAAKPRAPQEAIMMQDEWTTVMLRNLPNDYTREMLLSLLDKQGFEKLYNFVYMPIDFHRKAGLGYAFVNMVSHEAAEHVHERLLRFEDWETPSQKVLDVCWSEPSQGLEAHIERYRNSPVMHPDVAEKFKPVLFESGIPVPFPGPTKRIRPPRLKHGNHRL